MFSSFDISSLSRGFSSSHVFSYFYVFHVLLFYYFTTLLSQLAAEHRYRYRKELTAVDQPTSLNLFDEDVYNAMDEKGHIVRKDMFKGAYDRSHSISIILYVLKFCTFSLIIFCLKFFLWTLFLSRIYTCAKKENFT